MWSDGRQGGVGVSFDCWKQQVNRMRIIDDVNLNIYKWIHEDIENSNWTSAEGAF